MTVVLVFLGAVLGALMLDGAGGFLFGGLVGYLTAQVSRLRRRVREMEGAQAAPATVADVPATAPAPTPEQPPPSAPVVPSDVPPVPAAPQPPSRVEPTPVEHSEPSPVERPVQVQPPVAYYRGPSSGGDPSRLFAWVKTWATSGNVPVKVGVLLLLIGLAFLLGVALDQGWITLTIGMRHLLVALLGVLLMVVGWRGAPPQPALRVEPRGRRDCGPLPDHLRGARGLRPTARLRRRSIGDSDNRRRRGAGRRPGLPLAGGARHNRRLYGPDPGVFGRRRSRPGVRLLRHPERRHRCRGMVQGLAGTEPAGSGIHSRVDRLLAVVQIRGGRLGDHPTPCRRTDAPLHGDSAPDGGPATSRHPGLHDQPAGVRRAVHRSRFPVCPDRPLRVRDGDQRRGPGGDPWGVRRSRPTVSARHPACWSRSIWPWR